MSKLSLNQNREENAISFMMFANFGIASADNRNEVIDAVVDRAYVDAVRRVLSFKNDKKHDKRIEAKNQAKKLIIDSIDELKKCNAVFDIWHRQLCDGLVNIYKGYEYNDGYEFSYGIAQKWVNMVLKYLYIIYYYCSAHGYDNTDYQLAFGNMILKYVSEFHVPIDGAIIKGAKNDFGITRSFKSWSKINDYEKYMEFQNALRNCGKFDDDPTSVLHYSPIDWEGPAWIDFMTN